MPESERSNPRFRLVGQIAGGIFCLAYVGVLWMESGSRRGVLFGLGGLVAGIAILICLRVTERRRLASRKAEQKENASTRRSRLIRQFVGGMLYLALVCMVLTSFTGCNFFLVFGAVVTGVVFTGTMILVWATSWAVRTDTRKGQFSIRTLLFLTLIAAIYLGAIRWLADLAGDRLGGGGASFLAAAVICLVLTVISLPFLIQIMESLVWFAAWLVRRPWVQRRLAR